MIKVTELQIGDYLRINHDHLCIKKDTIIEVRVIDANNTFEDHIGCVTCRPLDEEQFEGGIWCDYLDPIPLTAEILEKNTSGSNGNTFGWKNYALIADFLIEDRVDRFCLCRLVAGCKYSTFWICNIHYVHELQNALRLFGIEKKLNYNRYE